MITCPRCGRTSWNPNDETQGYCGFCHWWTSDPILSRFIPPRDLTEPDLDDAIFAAERYDQAIPGATE